MSGRVEMVASRYGRCVRLLCGLAVAFAAGRAWGAADERPPTVRRADVFEFTRAPTVAVAGDRVTIRFAVKGYCDAAVAIENSDGEIVRHLAAGVLGRNAPPPFQKNSLEQTLVWDGKDDQGAYVDDKADAVVRVSLGLKARFERELFWSPHKRTRAIKYLHNSLVMDATPEGVYAFDGGNCDHILFFDHEGNYVRTVYPPAPNLLDNIDGLTWRTFPQDGERLPVKPGPNPQETFLKTDIDRDGGGVQCMVAGDDVLYIASQRLNRLPLSEDAGKVQLVGPELWHTVKLGRMHSYRGGTEKLPVESMALSPDGKWLYLTGHMYTRSWHNGGLHGVSRMRPGSDERPELFVGNLEQGKSGEKNGEFNVAACVAVDAEGRVYVADYANSRVQIFDPSGKHLKNIKTPHPAWVEVNPKNGEIYVFSWKLPGGGPRYKMKARFTRFGPFENPEVRAAYPLPIHNPLMNGHSHRVTIDFWTDPPVIWFSESPATASYRTARLDRAGARLMIEKGRKLEVIRDFTKDAREKITFIRPTRHMKQRLYFDPAHEKLYAGEMQDPSPIHVTGFHTIPAIDPNTGRVETVELPFDTEDMAFDINGRAYLRTADGVARFDALTWREIPFDYGDRLKGMSSQGLRKCRVQSAIRFAGVLGVASGQLGGMHVSPKGNVVVTVANPASKPSRKATKNMHGSMALKYTPQVYPGRARPWEVHVFDRHGQVLYEDAAPGTGRMAGVMMDEDDNLYVVIAGVGRVKGQKYFNPISCSVFRMKPGTKILSTRGALPLPKGKR
ncbi:MAG: hypothetical protein R6V58_07145, partial [Planctomycetota bacterium]